MILKQGTNRYFSNSVSLGKLTVHIGNCNGFFLSETQTEEEQVNIIEPSDPITPMDIGNFAPGTDSMDIYCWY
jgi:hypothetical protein